MIFSGIASSPPGDTTASMCCKLASYRVPETSIFPRPPKRGRQEVSYSLQVPSIVSPYCDCLWVAVVALAGIPLEGKNGSEPYKRQRGDNVKHGSLPVADSPFCPQTTPTEMRVSRVYCLNIFLTSVGVTVPLCSKIRRVFLRGGPGTIVSATATVPEAPSAREPRFRPGLAIGRQRPGARCPSTPDRGDWHGWSK
jgi:hypothetical protein